LGGLAIEAKLKPLTLISLVQSLTADNRKEYADHLAIDLPFGIQTYFPIRTHLEARQQLELQRTAVSIHSQEAANGKCCLRGVD
jgi:hypothetical protein